MNDSSGTIIDFNPILKKITTFFFCSYSFYFNMLKYLSNKAEREAFIEQYDNYLFDCDGSSILWIRYNSKMN